jgi:hypothetical protein
VTTGPLPRARRARAQGPGAPGRAAGQEAPRPAAGSGRPGRFKVRGPVRRADGAGCTVDASCIQVLPGGHGGHDRITGRPGPMLDRLATGRRPESLVG